MDQVSAILAYVIDRLPDCPVEVFSRDGRLLSRSGPAPAPAGMHRQVLVDPETRQSLVVFVAVP